MKLILLFLSLIPFTFLFQPPTIPNQDNPPDVCQEAGNILPNCNFDDGTNNWQVFVEDGTAHFGVLQGGGECHAPLCPAGHIVTESHFVGGIYQQVPVSKGKTYYANVVWLVFDSLANDKGIFTATGGIGRQLGIDPYGGADPKSSDVIWGAENWRNDCKICDKQEVVATAQADTITLFLRIDNRWRLRAAEKGFAVPPSKDQFWIDDIGMKEVGGEAAAVQEAPTEPPPTDTPAPPPPTDTPVPPAPTDTPVSESPPMTPTPVPAENDALSAEAPVEVAQAETSESESVSPLATPIPAEVIAPPPTLTPTNTPPPTDTPAPRPTQPPPPTPEPEEEPVLMSAGLMGAAGGMICIGGVVLAVMGVVMAGLVWLYRLGWGEVEEAYDDEDEDDFDDGEEIIVEIVE